MRWSEVRIFGAEDWDSLVESVYGRPYKFQKQGG
jgi:hypothetical protein